jgi:hypothetical protein
VIRVAHSVAQLQSLNRVPLAANNTVSVLASAEKSVGGPIFLGLFGDNSPGLNRGQEGVPISVGLVGVGHRKLSDRLVERGPAAHVACYHGRIAGPCMSPRKRAPAQFCIEGPCLIKCLLSRRSLGERLSLL